MHYYRRRPLGYTALGAASCVDQAYDSVANGEADIDTAEGREELAKTTANCAAVAVCTAYGAAAASELCGQIGEFCAEILIGVFNEIADAFSKFWGGGSEERKKRRRQMMAAANKSYEDVQSLIWNQWYISLESTTKLYKKLFGKDPTLEFTMFLFKPYIALDKIPNTAQLKPKYLGDPPTCYPGPGCVMPSSDAGYVFVPPGGYCSAPPKITIEIPGSAKGVGIYMGPTQSRYTTPACPAPKISAFFYIKDNIQKMVDYVEEIVKAEVYVALALADEKARQIAEAEAKKKDEAARKRRAQLIATMKKYREKRAREQKQRDFWSALIGSGSWGIIWRPQGVRK